MDLTRTNTVHLYVKDWLPSCHGSGTNSRIYSNVRAYLDLGFEVEVVYIQTKRDLLFVPEPTLPGVRWTHLQFYDKHSLPLKLTGNRIAYWLGWPLCQALDYGFKIRELVRKEVYRREAVSPGSIHHFEYLATASAAIHLPHVNCIWSHHDIESKFTSELKSIRYELEGRVLQRQERRALNYLRKAERLTAKGCRLILCIAKHECEILRREWECENAEFFPMSWPIEEPPARKRDWLENDKLRLFHLGRIDSLPSFRSLQFLLKNVFPLLSDNSLKRIELIVVGEIRETQRARTILDLAQKYPQQVHFAGFQNNVRDVYADVDLQVVASTEATGLRTRIVESFAYGVPVLSTTVGAAGLEGLRHNQNIVLADDPETFARSIENLSRSKTQLQTLAEAGRNTYSAIYSRSSVASKLQSLLTQHVG